MSIFNFAQGEQEFTILRLLDQVDTSSWLDIAIANTPYFIGIGFVGTESFRENGLI